MKALNILVFPLLLAGILVLAFFALYWIVIVGVIGLLIWTAIKSLFGK